MNPPSFTRRTPFISPTSLCPIFIQKNESFLMGMPEYQDVGKYTGILRRSPNGTKMLDIRKGSVLKTPIQRPIPKQAHRSIFYDRLEKRSRHFPVFIHIPKQLDSFSLVGNGTS